MPAKYDVQGIIQYLQGLEDFIPEKYDGSYELVRETVNAYATLSDYSNVDFRDLNLVYLMAVGTWKHSVEKKKETVNLSHLPDSEKARLIRVLDAVWAKAVAHEYEHSEAGSKDASIGMFGTGFYSFQNKTTPACSKDFIKMCVDIEQMNDTDAMFDRAEQVLSRDFKGMAAASASVVLHCLKPTVFPILNGNMGIDSMFDAVGLKLKKKNSIGTYISNARIIREFRDKNVDFKNYRVFDYASRVLDDYKEKIEYRIDIDKLKKEIELYKKDFPRVAKEETYKWKAIKCFQDNFDIDAEDFPKMLERSLEKSYNLLARSMYFAKGAILEIANYNPEYTREMFRNLFNEEEPVLNRIKQFEEDAEIYFQLHEADSKAKNHYQDVKASSVYLFFRYPEKYYIYLSTKFENAAKQIGYGNIPKNGSMERVQAYFDMTDQIYDYAKTDAELLQLNQSRLDDECYKDSTNHVLAEDIVYFLNWQYKTENSEEETTSSDYIPSLEEYDPGLKSEQYQEVFDNPSKISKSQLDTLYYIYLMGGEATCKQVANKYGYSFSRYISHAVTVAKRVEQETGCPVNQREDGSNQYWSILFFGKEAGGGEGTFVWKLRKPVEEAIKAMIEKGFFEDMENREEYPKNIILYGPPGTGKTYHTVMYAVAIIEGKDIEDVYEESKGNYDAVKARYEKYLKNKEIAFTTFHQSYGYEEFIEGIKPQMDSDEADADGDISYVIEKGVFNAFCDQARTKSKAQEDYGFNNSPVVWKVSLGGTGKNPDRDECMLNNHIRVGFDEHGAEITDETDFSTVGGKAVLNAFMNKMRIGDIIFSCYSASTIDAIGVVTGDYEWHDEYEHLKRVRNVKWLVKDLNYNIVDINNGSAMTLSTVYKLNISLSDVLKVLSDVAGADNQIVSEDSDKRFVFIIDEINRGNISKVFGELITLIEPSKRIGQAEETTLILPYSKKPFGVPNNVYIIGTMNTADRSIALMDTSLRRRFHFIEMLPDSRLLEDIEDIDGIDVSAMLRMMNKRIELLIDREHMIGHSYFMRLKETPTLGCLSEIFKNNIIPLLQEYFFDDYEKIRLILGDNQKQDVETQFITKQVYDPSEYFGDAEGVDDLASYIIHEDVFDKKPEAYIGIYK